MRAAPAGLGVEVARIALGTADLLVLSRVPSGQGEEHRAFPGGVHSVLGARQLIQGATTARLGGASHTVGGCVDALHAVSMVGVAVVSSRFRRAAVVQVAIASALALIELRRRS
ncbi:MAG: hypothetical protein HIU86_02470 [Acidobacteria bacterium]|nr:hypothetical protein [Acidobacteriota bacterium]